METRALGRFAVRAKLPDDVDEVLALADQFRRAYCDIQQQRHERTVDLRNAHFPRLFAAMGDYETCRARIYEVEKRIKSHHSDVRNRNAVLAADEARLIELRNELKRLKSLVSEERRPYKESLTAYRRYWRSLADWKNVKSLVKRRAEYERVAFPSQVLDYLATPTEEPLDGTMIDPAFIAAFGAMWMGLDLQERDLFTLYQSRGLHSAIRAEIIAASKPKLKKDQPGIRYVYGRKPEPKPWELITLQISGGLTISEAKSGTPGLKIRPDDREGQPAGRFWRVWQQIGTADIPRRIEYVIGSPKAELGPAVLDDVTIQRWTLRVTYDDVVLRNRDGRVYQRKYQRAWVVPIAKMADRNRPRGDGTFAYDLTWYERPEGVQVCRFWGDHVFERLVLPWRLVDQRTDLEEVQLEYDRMANDLLAARGKKTGRRERQGVIALGDWCRVNPQDAEAGNALDESLLALHKSRRVTRKAIRKIEEIYRNVAKRVCELHAAVTPDPLELDWLKRYDTRDLLKPDKLRDARRLLFAVAPGKLRQCLTAYGLDASGEVRPEPSGGARNTDVFGSYVENVCRDNRQVASV